MKWSKQLYSVLILSLIFMISIHSISSVFMEYENSSDQVMTMDLTFDDESFIPSSVNETAAYGPPVGLSVFWGWAGNLSYTYWDVTENEGIPGANITCHLGNPSPDFYDLGNGSYLVEMNTTCLRAQYFPYSLVVTFDKAGFENQVAGTIIRVLHVHTHLVVFSPEPNQIRAHPRHLMIPKGDSIDLQFLYNDTEDSDGYVGGLEGAQGFARIVGPTLVEHYIQLTDLSEGYYNLTFDTTEDWLYESVGGIPTSHELPYMIYIEFTLENRLPWEVCISIYIFDIPTELEVELPPELDYWGGLNPGQSSMFVSLTDLWSPHNGVLIPGVNITVESSDPTLLEIVSITEDPTEVGVYEIILNHTVPASVQATIPAGGCMPNPIVYDYVNLTINIEKDGYDGQSQMINVGLVAFGRGGWTPPGTTFGLPITVIAILVVGGLYIRDKRRKHIVKELPGND